MGGATVARELEHRLKRTHPGRHPTSPRTDSTDVEAARAQLTQLEAVLQESLVALAAIADEMAAYREKNVSWYNAMHLDRRSERE